MKKRAVQIILVLDILICILAIVFGIVVLSQPLGYSPSTSTAFGADFYTESYRAAAKAANNINTLSKITQLGFGFSLIVFGLFRGAGAAKIFLLHEGNDCRHIETKCECVVTALPTDDATNSVVASDPSLPEGSCSN